VPHICLSSLKLILQFWHFKLCKNLTLTDAVANIDPNPTDVAGNFGVEVNLLIGLKLTGNRERTCEIASCDGDHGSGSWLGWRRFAAMLEQNQENSCQTEAEKRCDPQDALARHRTTLFVGVAKQN
jgi:hypothetical protein